jgi:acyl-CoA thioesterase FadM
MARTKLACPESFIFHTQLPVRVTDLNYANHLANDAVLSLLHEARLRFLNQYFQVSEADVGDGVGLIMADSVIVYKSQGFYGDLLDIAMTVTDVSAYSFDIFYLLQIAAKKQEIVRAKTTLVSFDYQKRTMVCLPKDFRQALLAG